MFGNRQDKQQAFAITPVQSASSGGIGPMVWVIAILFGIAVFATAQNNAKPDCSEAVNFEPACNPHPATLD